jgi:hypothetical protein
MGGEVTTAEGFLNEHQFGTLLGPMADGTTEELLRLARLYIGEGDAERLVGWIAWRTGRNQAMAGDRPAIARLEHALAHWLTDHQRAQLLRWLRRRLPLGLSPVPD